MLCAFDERRGTSLPGAVYFLVGGGFQIGIGSYTVSRPCIILSGVSICTARVAGEMLNVPFGVQDLSHR